MGLRRIDLPVAGVAIAMTATTRLAETSIGARLCPFRTHLGPDRPAPAADRNDRAAPHDIGPAVERSLLPLSEHRPPCGADMLAVIGR